MSNLIDIHQHIIYEMDDGAKDQSQTQRMLKAAENQGVHTIIATSHVLPEKRFDMRRYMQRLNAINEYLDQTGSSIYIWPGAEILYTSETLHLLDDRRIPTLAMSNAVLVEFMPYVQYDQLYQALRQLANGGYIPVLAHVERYECLLGELPYLDELRDQLGVMIQMNCSTVLKRSSPLNKPIHFAHKLLASGRVDFVASDAHNDTSRPILMRDAYVKLKKRYGVDMAENLLGRNQQHFFRGLAVPVAL